MTEQTRSLVEIVQELPPDLQDEVQDFVEFLLEKRAPKRVGKLNLDWRGSLRDLRDEYTSVELQHKANIRI